MAVEEIQPNEEGLYTYSSSNAFVYTYVQDKDTYTQQSSCLIPTPENPTPTTAGYYKLWINEDTTAQGKTDLSNTVLTYVLS